MADDPMWCLVLFDLPVQTKEQRRDATRFRHFLIDRGFSMVQFSVYVRYWPTGARDNSTIRRMKLELPAGGQVRVLYLTDKQWAGGLRFDNATSVPEPPEPEQLMIF